MLSSCVTLQDPEGTQEYRADQVSSLRRDQTSGQTFQSRRPGLNQVDIWLQARPNPAQPAATLTAELYNTPGDAQPIASVSYPLASLAKTSQVSIQFPPRSDPPESNYYLLLSVSGGEVLLFGRSEDTYPYGQLYVNGEALPADLSFRLGYEYGLTAILNDISAWISQVWLIVPLLAMLWLPGRLLLHLTGFDHRLDGGERSAASIGLSMGLIPVVLLWTSTAGINWSKTGILIAFIVLAFGYIVVTRRDFRGWNWNKIEPTTIAIGAVFVFSLGVRLAMVRDYAAPAWIDSVHHALLTRLILETGAYPSTLAPFLEISQTSYHTGFHSLAAVFTWLSGLDLTQSLLILGQILNTTAVLAVYLLATSLTNNRWAGVFAGLVTGLFTPMPAYYTSWGRYTQLAGLIILPTAWIFLLYVVKKWQSLRQEKWQLISAAGLAGLSCAGLFLVHYRVLAFLAVLAFAWFVIRIIRDIFYQKSLHAIPGVLLGAGIIAGIAIVISLPWWPGMIESLLTPSLALRGETQLFSGFSWSFINPAFGKYALGLAGLGLLWGLYQRQAFSMVIALWVGLLLVAGNLGVFSIPGAALITNLSVAIMLFMPVSILSGYLIAWVITGWTAVIPSRWKPVYISLAILLIGSVSLLAARALMPILNPGTILYRQADTPGIDWLKEHTPQEATVVVNPFLWGYELYAGLDGGYWISPLALRQTIPPPVLYGLNYAERSFVQIGKLSQEIIQNVKNPERLHQLLVNNSVEYIFIGARGGPLSPSTLNSSALFQNLYTQDGVYIFKVIH
jgi:hypothetical protein